MDIYGHGNKMDTTISLGVMQSLRKEHHFFIPSKLERSCPSSCCLKSGSLKSQHAQAPKC